MKKVSNNVPKFDTQSPSCPSSGEVTGAIRNRYSRLHPLPIIMRFITILITIRSKIWYLGMKDVGGVRYESRSCGQPSHDSFVFEPTKCLDDKADSPGLQLSSPRAYTMYYSILHLSKVGRSEGKHCWGLCPRVFPANLILATYIAVRRLISLLKGKTFWPERDSKPGIPRAQNQALCH